MKNIFYLAIIITALAAFFASGHPDGLDFVSEKLGFAKNSTSTIGLMPDYSLPFLPAGGLATSLAGLSGIIILLGLFWLAASVLKIRQKINRS